MLYITSKSHLKLSAYFSPNLKIPPGSMIFTCNKVHENIIYQVYKEAKRFYKDRTKFNRVVDLTLKIKTPFFNHLLMVFDSSCSLITGLTVLLCLSPQISLLLVTSLWILLPISYTAMEEPSNINHPNPNPKSFKEVPYSPLKSNPSDDASKTRLSSIEMLSLLWQTEPLFIGMFVSIFCKQLLVSGVMTTMAFSDDSVTPRNQYLLYVLASGTGELLGRPYLGYLFHCGIEDKFTIRKLWILSSLNVFIVIFMVFVSWFRFGIISHVYTAAVVPFVNTFLAGIVFVNSFHFAGEGLSVVERRFCRALLTGALWAANMAVALTGLTVEYQLREHCVYIFEDVACFTRSQSAWDASVLCVV